MGERTANLVNCSSCLLIFLLFAPLQGSSQSAGEFGQAMSEFRAGNYSLAAALFARAETASPGTTDALLYEGKSFVHLQKYVEAENAIRLYLVQHPKSDDALYLLGFVLHREGKPRESLETYTKAAALKPPSGDDLKIVGLNYVLLEDYASAIHWLEKAVELDPKNHEAWYFLGRAYYTRSRIPEAKAAFERVLQLHPNDAKAENNLGLVLESEARPAEAIEAYKQAIAWQQNSEVRSEQPHLNLGGLLLDQDRAEEALPTLEEAARLAPANSLCRMKLGMAYLRTSRLDKAQIQLEEAARLDPENAAIHFQLGKLYKQMHSMERARKEFARAEEIQSRAASVTTPKSKQ
jgi:tetratricopeptide (TPR) repeat protein